MRLWIPPYLSIRHMADRVRLGIMPPLAWDVEQPPSFLVPLLAELSRPTDHDAAVESAIRHSGWNRSEAETLIEDLHSAGVLVPAWDRSDRYDRHQLYYRMLGVDGHAQDKLARVTVGLIGMGGIGTHLAVHLAAAGVGALVITDGDVVELSNLTRQTLFREADVGRCKVEAAAERLGELRSDLRVDAIPRAFDSPTLAAEVAARADILLLSADRPVEVHSWTNTACLAAETPFSAAGYIEGHGCIGPLLHVPETPCFECIRLSAHALADQQLDPESVEAATAELNPGWQAPSYGPLNALVAAIQANEAIRWLLGTRTATTGRRLLVDSRTYDVTWEDFEVSGECNACGRTASDTPVWHRIALQYQEERDNHSFNA
ncbi:MAG: TOMM precursor leader peptide-binding protein, partial [Pseudonocardiaceae bacterium]